MRLCKAGLLAAFTLIVILSGQRQARADENWACTFKETATEKPTPVSFRFNKRELQLRWPNWAVVSLAIQKNNQYGVVAIRTFSELEPNETVPTVGAVCVVLNRMTHEFWLSDAMGGTLPGVNLTAIHHGACIEQ